MLSLLLKLEDFRLLPVFVAVSMVVGIAVGNLLSISDFELTPPIDAIKDIAAGSFDASVPGLISLGVPIGLFLMMYPAMTNVRLTEVGQAFRSPRQLGVVVVLNYLVAPFFMLLLSPVFGILYLAFARMFFELVIVLFKIKDNTENAIRELHALGLKVIMATGDNQRTAEAVARQLGIDEVRAPLLPDDKVTAVGDLQQRGHRVAMIGDGVNDAPALIRANVGIAVGSGTEVSVESANGSVKASASGEEAPSSREK